MYQRATAILAIFCLALVSGCASTSKPKSSKKKRTRQYQEVLMPLQTGSTLQRRAYVMTGPETETKKKPKKKESAPKPEAQPSETPAPEEESTPPPERFR
jgi:uncharacterized lipoprotein